MTNERPIQWKTIERHIACVCERVGRAAMIIAHPTIQRSNPPEAAPPPITARRGNFYLPARAWHYTTILLCLLHCITYLRKIQPLEVLLVLSCSWKLIIYMYTWDKTWYLFSHFLQRYVLLMYNANVMCWCILQMLYIDQGHSTAYNEELSEPGVHSELWSIEILFWEICPVCKNL